MSLCTMYWSFSFFHSPENKPPTGPFTIPLIITSRKKNVFLSATHPPLKSTLLFHSFLLPTKPQKAAPNFTQTLQENKSDIQVEKEFHRQQFMTQDQKPIYTVNTNCQFNRPTR